MKNNTGKKESERFPMVNFFDLKDEDLIVLNPYDFNAAINRLKNLTIEDVKDDLRHFQKKNLSLETMKKKTLLV
jgi:c-di-AMP phosphodiesterase-like protein